jgi:hypothetical protein
LTYFAKFDEDKIVEVEEQLFSEGSLSITVDEHAKNQKMSSGDKNLSAQDEIINMRLKRLGRFSNLYAKLPRPDDPKKDAVNKQ